MEPGNKIILETERLIFRRHIPADIEAYCAMEMDPGVRGYVGGHPRKREDAERKFNNELPYMEPGLGMRATVLKSNGLYIGRCGIYPHFNPDGEVFPDEASLGYYIASGYQGRGFAIEAASAFVKFGFEELHLNRIVTTVQVGNDASVHILEKLGFVLIRTETGPRSFYHFALQNPANNKTSF